MNGRANSQHEQRGKRKLAKPSFASQFDSNAAYPDPLKMQAEWLRRKFKRFVRAAWPIIEPGTPFEDNWHIDAVCNHLQAVTNGKINCLIINIPPRCMKSSLVSVLWPAWEWTQTQDLDEGKFAGPHLQYLTGSYDDSLATRDAVNARRLIQSEWYQARFGAKFQMTGDQNAKQRYQNDKNGHRIVVSVGGGITGEGGHRKIIDDPHDAVRAMNSDAERKKGIDQYDHGFSTRDNDPENTAEVIIMQRVAMDDLTGHVLAKMRQAGVRVDHLRIPMEFDGVRRRTVLGEYDPRTKVGELMWPTRFTKRAVKLLKVKLGSYGVAAQLQQEPTPRGGHIFKRDQFKFYAMLPRLEEIVVSVDCSFKDLQTSDFVAIQAWGRIGQDKFLLRRFKDRLDFAATCDEVDRWRVLYPQAVAFLVEDKANGPAVISTMQRRIPGLIPFNPNEYGSKLARGYACQPQQQAGQLWLPSADVDPGVIEYLTEVCGVPGAPNDDEFDATTQAILWMSLRTGQGIFDYMRSEAAAVEATRAMHAQQATTPEKFTKTAQQLWQEEEERKVRQTGTQVNIGTSPWHATVKEEA